jgi:hypothetical protein
MPIDMSTVALIAGALGFYLQLIASYRRKVREWELDESRSANRKKGKKVGVPAALKPSFGSFSKKPLDWVIGGVGYLMIMFGILVYVDWLKIAGVKSVWFAPVAVGIILFSWFFH